MLVPRCSPAVALANLSALPSFLKFFKGQLINQPLPRWKPVALTSNHCRSLSVQNKPVCQRIHTRTKTAIIFLILLNTFAISGFIRQQHCPTCTIYPVLTSALDIFSYLSDDKTAAVFKANLTLNCCLRQTFHPLFLQTQVIISADKGKAILWMRKLGDV